LVEVQDKLVVVVLGKVKAVAAVEEAVQVWDKVAGAAVEWVEVRTGVVVVDVAWAWRHLQIRSSVRTSNHTLSSLVREDWGWKTRTKRSQCSESRLIQCWISCKLSMHASLFYKGKKSLRPSISQISGRAGKPRITRCVEERLQSLTKKNV